MKIKIIFLVALSLMSADTYGQEVPQELYSCILQKNDDQIYRLSVDLVSYSVKVHDSRESWLKWVSTRPSKNGLIITFKGDDTRYAGNDTYKAEIYVNTTNNQVQARLKYVSRSGGFTLGQGNCEIR